MKLITQGNNLIKTGSNLLTIETGGGPTPTALYTVSGGESNKDITEYGKLTTPNGTAGTPSASKGTVSNHSITVTPSVTNSTGWITGGTKTGTGVSVAASELVSGTASITSTSSTDVTNYKYAQVSDSNLKAANIANGVTILGITGTHSGGITPSGNIALTATTSTQTGINVTNYATASVAPTPSESKTVTPNAAGQTVSPSSGKLLSSVVINGDSDLAAGNIKSGVDIFGVTGTYPSGTGSVTATTSAQTGVNVKDYATITVNPTPSETKSFTPTAAGSTITPTSGKLLSSVTVSGDSKLVAGNIKKGITIFGVTGTYEGSGGGGETGTLYAGQDAPSAAVDGDLWVDTSDEGSTFQMNNTNASVSSTTLSEQTATRITVEKSGTYDAYWHSGYARSSGNATSQLFVNGSAVGDQYTASGSGAVLHAVVALTAGQTVGIGLKSASRDYTATAGNLIIVKQR